jgi:hypothetical protein
MCSTEKAIASRCTALGLTQDHACRLALAATPASIIWALGLDSDSLEPLKPRNWLWMAAKNASVSYRDELNADVLLQILVTGEVSSQWRSHVLHLIDEAPIQLVTMAIEQAAQLGGCRITTIWQNVEKLAEEISRNRTEAWKITI